MYQSTKRRGDGVMVLQARGGSPYVHRLIFWGWNCHRSVRVMRTRVSRWLLVVPALLLLVHPVVAAEAKRVLVLYSNSRLGKGSIAFDSGLRQTINGNPGQPIQIFS